MPRPLYPLTCRACLRRSPTLPAVPCKHTSRPRYIHFTGPQALTSHARLLRGIARVKARLRHDLDAYNLKRRRRLARAEWTAAIARRGGLDSVCRAEQRQGRQTVSVQRSASGAGAKGTKGAKGHLVGPEAAQTVKRLLKRLLKIRSSFIAFMTIIGCRPAHMQNDPAVRQRDLVRIVQYMRQLELIRQEGEEAGILDARTKDGRSDAAGKEAQRPLPRTRFSGRAEPRSRTLTKWPDHFDMWRVHLFLGGASSGALRRDNSESLERDGLGERTMVQEEVPDVAVDTLEHSAVERDIQLEGMGDDTTMEDSSDVAREISRPTSTAIQPEEDGMEDETVIGDDSSDDLSE